MINHNSSTFDQTNAAERNASELFEEDKLRSDSNLQRNYTESGNMVHDTS